MRLPIWQENAPRDCTAAENGEKTLNGLTILIYDVKLFVDTNSIGKWRVRICELKTER